MKHAISFFQKRPKPTVRFFSLFFFIFSIFLLASYQNCSNTNSIEENGSEIPYPDDSFESITPTPTPTNSSSVSPTGTAPLSPSPTATSNNAECTTIFSSPVPGIEETLTFKYNKSNYSLFLSGNRVSVKHRDCQTNNVEIVFQGSNSSVNLVFSDSSLRVLYKPVSAVSNMWYVSTFFNTNSTLNKENKLLADKNSLSENSKDLSSPLLMELPLNSSESFTLQLKDLNP